MEKSAMYNDMHIHMENGPCDPPEEFLRKTALAGITGGAVISLPPPSFERYQCDQTWTHRLDHIVRFTESCHGFFPFFWLDPSERDAKEQIKAAKAAGVRGIKVICTHFAPKDYISVFEGVADAGLPLMFHSGILWDGQVSSEYNRPIAFECLLKIRDLRFSLAHISWPWCDECIALYGKISNSARRISGAECGMFIDTTPGTPPIYREEVLRKVYLVGYGLHHKVIFGSDNSANCYKSDRARRFIERDSAILKRISEDEPELDCNAIRKAVFHDNFMKFIMLNS